MLKQLTAIFLISLFASAACVKSQTEANAANSNSNATGSSQSESANSANQNAETKPISNKSNAKFFLGQLDYKRVQINLTRDGNNLAGIYQYEKVGKDLKLAGTIDASGNFTLQETDEAGNKTGEWKGAWKDADGRATLTGKWKNPKGGKQLDFSADEQSLEFTGGAKITTKSSNENKPKQYEITAEYPELSGVDTATANNFNQIIKGIVEKENKDFKADVVDLTPEDYKRFSSGGAPLYDQLTYDTKMANDDVISLVFNDDSFTGGAHGSSATITVNYDLKNNRALKLADIFEPNSSYLKTLSDLSRAELKPKLQKDGVLDEEMLNPGTEPKDENFQAWVLTKKGLLITFDPYQVAAYVAGPQEITIPYSKLQSILRKDGVAAKLAK